MEALEKEHDLPGNRLFYLATDPEFFAPIVDALSQAGLTKEADGGSWRRVVIEKPFGHDLSSARALNTDVLKRLREHQIYRIDHYLGKETVQNLLAFRFGNAIFEPIMNRQFVDHVQITAAETVGMEGRRGAFYDHAGRLRDVIQNHLLQILALVAMEPPASMKSRDISDTKLKVLRQLPAWTDYQIERRVVRAQYQAGTVNGKPVPGYLQEEGVAPDSTTETFVAIRTTRGKLALVRRSVSVAGRQAVGAAGYRSGHPLPSAAAAKCFARWNARATSAIWPPPGRMCSASASNRTKAFTLSFPPSGRA